MQSSSSPRLSVIRIFDEADEVLFLGVPIFFIAVALVVACFHGIEVPNSSNKFVDAILLTIGLQSAHNAFTFSMIRLPEFATWISEKRKRENKNVVRKWVIIGLTLLAVYLVVYYFAAQEQTLHISRLWGVTPWQLFFFGFWLVNLWHTYSQYYGLSMLYNSVYISESGAPSASFSRVLRFEKKIFRVFLIIAAFYSAAYVAFDSHIQSWVVVSIGFMAMIAVVSPVLWFPKPLRKAKLLFSVRLLLLLPFLFPGLNLTLMGPAMNINHNFEYWMVYKKVVKASKIRRRILFVSMSTVGILVFVALTLIRNEGFFDRLNAWSGVHTLIRSQLVALTMAVTTLHYFMDGDIFHFSDPLTSKYIAPLLLANPRAQIDQGTIEGRSPAA